LRGADDVKESVRAAGLLLCRALRSVTLRLVDPTGGQGVDGGAGGGGALALAGLPASLNRGGNGLTSFTPSPGRARDAQAAAEATLPLLLEVGLPSPVAEVRAVALDVLSEATKSAGGWRPLAGPVLPALVNALLEALSALEDARLSYAEQHAARLGFGEKLEGARVAASRASPAAEALDLASRYTAEAALVAAAEEGGVRDASEALLARTLVADVVVAVAGQLKRGVGLNTKVGAARFARALAAKGGSKLLGLTPPGPAAAGPAAAAAGSSGGATATAANPQQQQQHASALLRPLIHGASRERSLTVRRAYAAAAAAVAAASGSPTRCDALVSEAVALYGGVLEEAEAEAAATTTTTTTTTRPVEERLAGGLLLRELLRASPDLFAARAASRALPLAFAARLDDDSDVAAAWAAIWEDGAPSEGAAVRAHAPELTAALKSGLSASRYGGKRAAALALAAMARLGAGEEVLGRDGGKLGEGLARVLLAELSAPRLWEGKEALLEAAGALGAAMVNGSEGGGEINGNNSNNSAAVSRELLAALVAALARQKVTYRAAALSGVEELLRAQGKVASTEGGAWPLASPPLLQALKQHAEKGAKAATTEAASAAAEEPQGGGEAAAAPPPLPLTDALRALKAAWAAASTSERSQDGAETARLLGGVLVLPGAGWAAWQAAAEVGRALLLASSAGEGASSSSWLPPLARGAAFVMTTTNVGAAREAALRLAAAVAGRAAAGAGEDDGTSAAELRAALAATGAATNVPLGDRTAALAALAVLDRNKG
jgi:proteasome component ECM29